MGVALHTPGCSLLGAEPVAVRVRPFEPARDTRAWEEFVENSSNGNLFHTRRFLSYHPPGRFNDRSLVFEGSGGWLAVAPACAAAEGDCRVWSAHRFSSHGGLVFSPAADLNAQFALVSALIHYLRDEGYHRATTRMPPSCVCAQPMDALPFVLDRCGFRVSTSELAQFVPLEGLDPETHYHPSVIRALKKACRAGLHVEESDRFEDFWRLLGATLADRHETRPTHTLEEIESLRRLCPGEVKLLAAFDGDRMLAGTVVFRLNARAWHTFYFAQDYAFQSLRPLTLVKHHLLNQATQAGCRVVNFGVCTASGAAIANLGLYRFKSHFGAQPCLRLSASIDLQNGGQLV